MAGPDLPGDSWSTCMLRGRLPDEDDEKTHRFLLSSGRQRRTPQIGVAPAHRQDFGAALRRKSLGIGKTSLDKKLREHDLMRADDRDG